MAELITAGLGIIGRLGFTGGGHVFSGTTVPLSGPLGTGTPEQAPAGSVYLYLGANHPVVFYNDGTQASPYWTPLSFDQIGLRAFHEDFRSGVGKAIADTAASVILASGVRVHGQGIAEIDSGLTVAQLAEIGAVGSLKTTDEAAHLVAFGIGDTALPFQPDLHAPLVVEVNFAHNAAITARATFLGFIGAAADALDPVVTGATVTLTLVLDDVAGLFQDSGLTDADGIFLPHNKSNEAATLATSATGVDVSKTIAAAGTYQRWRVEITAAGKMNAFIDKVHVGSITAALDADEEVAPSAYVESNAIAIKQLDAQWFSAWGMR